MQRAMSDLKSDVVGGGGGPSPARGPPAPPLSSASGPVPLPGLAGVRDSPMVRGLALALALAQGRLKHSRSVTLYSLHLFR